MNGEQGAWALYSANSQEKKTNSWVKSGSWLLASDTDSDCPALSTSCATDSSRRNTRHRRLMPSLQFRYPPHHSPLRNTAALPSRSASGINSGWRSHFGQLNPSSERLLSAPQVKWAITETASPAHHPGSSRDDQTETECILDTHVDWALINWRWIYFMKAGGVSVGDNRAGQAGNWGA